MEWVRWIYIETSTAQSTKHHEAIQCDRCIRKMPKPTQNSQMESSLIRLDTCKSNRIQCCARFPKRSEKEWQKEKSNRGQHLRDVWIIITSDVFTEQESHRHKNVNWYYQTRFDLTAHERTARFQSNYSLDSFAHSLILFQIRSIKAQIILHSITCAVLHQFTWNRMRTQFKNYWLHSKHWLLCGMYSTCVRLLSIRCVGPDCLERRRRRRKKHEQNINVVVIVQCNKEHERPSKTLWVFP